MLDTGDLSGILVSAVRASRVNTDKTRRLWAVFFPANQEPVAADEVDRLARHAPSGSPQAEHASEGAARVMSALSDGPFPLEAFAAGIAEVQQRLRPQGAARALRELAATLNRMMFEQMATVCDAHFEAGQLDEALTFVEGPVWRPQGLAAEMAGFNDALDRWHRERVVPLIEGYRAHLEHQAPRPVLPVIEAEDPLVVRLLRA